MASVHLDIPESALAAVHCGPQEFSAEMRLIAAMAWYGQGRISQKVAAEIAGLSGDEFVTALARMERSSPGADSEERDSRPSERVSPSSKVPMEPGQYFGVMNLTEDPLEFQNRIRGEWD